MAVFLAAGAKGELPDYDEATRLLDQALSDREDLPDADRDLLSVIGAA